MTQNPTTNPRTPVVGNPNAKCIHSARKKHSSTHFTATCWVADPWKKNSRNFCGVQKLQIKLTKKMHLYSCSKKNIEKIPSTSPSLHSSLVFLHFSCVARLAVTRTFWSAAAWALVCGGKWVRFFWNSKWHSPYRTLDKNLRFGIGKPSILTLR